MSQKIVRLIHRARWSDGTVVKFHFDRLAWCLMALAHALHILGILLALLVFDSLVQWWLLVVVSVGLAVGGLANTRLHIAANRAEELGVTKESAPNEVSFEWYARLSGLRARALEYCARRCEISERDLLEKADAAAVSGDHRSAENYRRRAERERRWAEFARTR